MAIVFGLVAAGSRHTKVAAGPIHVEAEFDVKEAPATRAPTKTGKIYLPRGSDPTKKK